MQAAPNHSADTPPGILSRYIDIRRELIEDLDLMAEILRQDHRDEAADALSSAILDKIDRKLAQLREDRLTIGVFGETCSGKSTLINSLSRREVTRPDVVSNTGVIMEFEYAEEETLTLHFLDGRAEATTWDQIPVYTDQLHNPENHKGIARVHIALPMPYLKNGIRFYDTPGLNDVVRDYSELSQQWLDSMGAVIITSLYPPFTRSEIDFLKRASHQCSRLFVVINLSQDYWAQRERIKEQVLRNIARDPDLRHHPDLAPERIRIYVINARHAWEATNEDDQEKLKAAGFTDFRDDLESFLAHDASRAVLASSIRSSFEVITLLQKLLTLRTQILFTERDVIEAKIADVEAAYQRAELKKYELFDAVDGEMSNLLDKVLPQVEKMVDQTTAELRDIAEMKTFGSMVESIELLYRRNLEEGAALEQLLGNRIEAIFQAAYRWLFRQLDDLLLMSQPQLDSSLKPFAFSRAQKSLLGIFSGYDDNMGMPEAVVGITTLGASLAASGQGMAVLTPLLGPLAFPVGGVGGFVLGMFARNFLKARTLKQHIDQQLTQIEDSRELLPDKLRVVLDRIAAGIKKWVSDYFEKLKNNLTNIMQEHRDKLNEEGYLENQRTHLEGRQAQLDQVRDRFLVRLQEIQALLSIGDNFDNPNHPVAEDGAQE